MTLTKAEQLGDRMRVRLSPLAFKRLCAEIYIEREGICEVCLKYVVEAVAHYDHIRTRGAGGSDTRDNLRLCHFACHDARHRGI